MDERRSQERSIIDFEAFFLRDGVISPLKIRDAAESGIGAYASLEFRPGQQGVLYARKPDTKKIEEHLSEVCWCVADPMAEHQQYPYRIGLKLLADDVLNI